MQDFLAYIIEFVVSHFNNFEIFSFYDFSYLIFLILKKISATSDHSAIWLSDNLSTWPGRYAQLYKNVQSTTGSMKMKFFTNFIYFFLKIVLSQSREDMQIALVRDETWWGQLLALRLNEGNFLKPDLKLSMFWNKSEF